MNNKGEKKEEAILTRWIGLDILKAICSFLVICIHCSVVSANCRAWGYINAINRIAVPCFFMITGFFYDKINWQKQSKKIFKLIVISNVIYGIFYAMLFLCNIDVDRNGIFTHNSFSIKTIFYILFLNEGITASHLWYLSAILYLLIIFVPIKKLVEKYKKIEILFLILAILITLLQPVISTYSEDIFGREFGFQWVCNFIIPGFSYFMMGYTIKRHNSYNIKEILLIGMFCISICIQMMEVYIFKSDGINNDNAYFMTSCVSVCLFLLAAKYSKVHKIQNPITNTVATIGKKFSADIYIYHIMINTTLIKFFNLLGIQSFNKILLKGWEIPIIVFILSIVVSIFILKTLNLMRSLIYKLYRFSNESGKSC